jgi:hypothetical protein
MGVGLKALLSTHSHYTKVDPQGCFQVLISNFVVFIINGDVEVAIKL